MVKQRRSPAVLGVLALLLAGCVAPPETATLSPLETEVITATPVEAEPEPEPEKALTICLVGEPDTLYLYGGSRLAATRHVMQALYDGPIDHRSYSYQPVILERVPSIAGGDAVTRTVTVRRGKTVVAATGEVVKLEEGVVVRPAGCYATACEVEFEEDEPIEMEEMAVTFVLREDVTWADGEPVMADDSAFAFQVASDPATPSDRYLVERTASYRALDEQRVLWVGLPGFVPPDYHLSFFAPLPRHQLDRRDPESLLTAEETRRYPLGWGPFVVEEWVPGDHLTLVRNANYYRASEGLPKLDRVVFRFTAGASEILAGLFSGECHVGTQDADYEPYIPLLVEAEREGLLSLVSSPSNGWEHIDFGLDPVDDYRTADLFGDVQVRQAIVQCIDRRAIVDDAVLGRSVVPDSYLPPQHPLYAGSQLTAIEYDPEAARALLEEAGWVDEDEDGIREAHRIPGVRSETPFEVTLLTNADNSVSQRVALIVKAHLADCGIRVNLESHSSLDLFAEGPEGLLLGRQFDLAETTWWLDEPPCRHYVSSEIPGEDRWYGSNPSGFSDPDFDDACEAALGALPGTEAYEDYHRQAQIIFSEQVPGISLFMRLRITAVRPEVRAFGLDPTATSELWDIERLDVAPVE